MPVEFILPDHIRMAIIHNPHLENNMTAKDFILSQDFPSHVTEPTALQKIFDTNEIWLAAWDDEDCEEGESNLLLQPTLPELFDALREYHYLTVTASKDATDIITGDNNG